MGSVLCATFEILYVLLVEKVVDHRMSKALRHCPCPWEKTSMLGKACGTTTAASYSHLPNMVESNVRV